jgi:histidyl-tRNA synthetase
MNKFAAPKGVSEYFPPRSELFEIVRDHLIAPAKLAGYTLIELPVFEDTALFERGVGESTDVVSKEMYTFEDRGGRSITLRPEGTAGVMRSVIENNFLSLSVISLNTSGSLSVIENFLGILLVLSIYYY